MVLGMYVSVDDIRQAPPDAVKAVATPTLIIVDQTGSVTESWVGKLPAEKEVETRNATGSVSHTVLTG